ncbi:M48 family metallopeptidase [Edaphobacter acidisoli]|uniref:M48 family metallopeptidase n=1 Tax=Edaphobacter acidisoli TaxID=2040573 RepID=UPI001669B0EB|nr:M48 family metallopeptidase [Edaphobacter acidisoli]
MKRLRPILLLLAVLAASFAKPAHAQNAPTVRASQQTSQSAAAYSLPPDKLKQAIDYSRVRVVLGFAESGWGILQLVLILALGIAAWMERVAVGASGNRWAQGFLFTFLLLLIITILTLPLDMIGHHEAVAYGQSVQGWGSWFGDQAKSFGLTFVLGGLFVMLLFWVMRKSPRRWWFWFWIPAIAAVIFGVFISPVLIDPLFYKFQPLEKTDPTLVAQLEQVVQRGGISIPPDHMFLMQASAKVTGLNAYVTGIGPSKRVVVWDTTIQKATPNEILFIFGHEMGHYVLGHIRATIEFSAALLLIEFYLMYLATGWLIRRYGPAWGVPSQHDWSALVVLVLVLSILSFVSEPIFNSYSRIQEHAADVYGQEAIHGIVADPQTTAQQAFQLLGETSLVNPSPNRFVEFWTFSHPSISERAAFAATYNPWLPGHHPKYFQH